MAYVGAACTLIAGVVIGQEGPFALALVLSCLGGYFTALSHREYR